MFGFFNVNKPAGCTSRDVVTRVQRALRCKIGHAGTLDPLATGVLVLAVGKATRLIQYVQGLKKSYQATFQLGRSSDTEDVEGNVEVELNARAPSASELNATIKEFSGEIEQVPPRYSALKVNGKRAYDLARRGASFDLASRPVTIYDLAVSRFQYPELDLYITCSSGTYVRSLGRDIAIACGTQAVMSQLVRTAIGDYRLSDSVDPEQINSETAAHFLQSPLLALDHLPRVQLDDENVSKLQMGQCISAQDCQDAAEVLALDSNGELIGIVRPRDGNQLQPVRNFSNGK